MKQTITWLALCAIAALPMVSNATTLKTGSTYYGGDRNTNLDDEVDKVRKSNSQGYATDEQTTIIPSGSGGGYIYTGGYVNPGYGGEYAGGQASPNAPTEAEIAAGTFSLRASTADEKAQYGDTICISKPKIDPHRDYVGPTMVFLPGSSCTPKPPTVATAPTPNTSGATQVNVGQGTGLVTVSDGHGGTVTQSNGSTWMPTSVTERVEENVVTGGNGTPESPYTYETCITTQHYDTGEHTRACTPQKGYKGK